MDALKFSRLNFGMAMAAHEDMNVNAAEDTNN